MNRTHIRMTPMERKAGRLMRAPDHPTGESVAGGNNQPSNTDPGATGNQSANNTGQSFNPETFWQAPSVSEPAPPSGGSAGTGNPADGTQGNQQQTSQAQSVHTKLTTQLQNLAFAPVFSTEIGEQVANGEWDGVNNAIAQVGRESVLNAVTMTAELMQMHGDHLISRVQSMIQEALGGRDNEAALMQEFPQAASNPAIRPMISDIFKQSMLHTNNDRQKAIAMTRDMLKFVGQGVGQDLGLNIAPGGPSDVMSQNALSLVEELMAR